MYSFVLFALFAAVSFGESDDIRRRYDNGNRRELQRYGDMAVDVTSRRLDVRRDTVRRDNEYRRNEHPEDFQRRFDKRIFEKESRIDARQSRRRNSREESRRMQSRNEERLDRRLSMTREGKTFEVPLSSDVFPLKFGTTIAVTVLLVAQIFSWNSKKIEE